MQESQNNLEGLAKKRWNMVKETWPDAFPDYEINFNGDLVVVHCNLIDQDRLTEQGQPYILGSAVISRLKADLYDGFFVSRACTTALSKACGVALGKDDLIDSFADDAEEQEYLKWVIRNVREKYGDGMDAKRITAFINEYTSGDLRKAANQELKNLRSNGEAPKR